MQRLNMRLIGLVVAVLALCTLVAACGDSQPQAQKSESQRQQSSYDRLTAAQPAHTMSYSPTRATINFWIDTWNKPDKLSYVYMLASNGQLVGYYIFKGLPVNYCAALTPTYRFVETPDDGSDAKNQQVPAPSIDGVYYSGGQCNTFYGRDATTNSYLEYTVSAGITPLIYERPLPRQNVQPLGFTEIKDVKG